MGLSPEAFYRLQYSELILLLDGFRDRLKREARRARLESAWLAHIFLLPHTPKDREPLTPAQLLGEEKPRSRAPRRVFSSSVDAFDAYCAAQAAAGKE